MPKIKIDGKSVEVESKKTIIQVADELGIDIPRFCYHEKLSVAANCRMCLVQVKNIGKPLPACATQVMDGMEISTKSKFTKDAQQSVMEFLLINHPLDCPICDQGGECDLQDTAVAYGASQTRYAEEKRVVINKNIGPLISTDLTRCIQCTRCVRFLKEVGGMQELGLIGRGEHAEISAYVDKAVESELSGNIIDLCPVGALTSKPFRYTARTWELERRPTISLHDSLGSNLEMHVKNDTVMRSLPRQNESINECWISDRDRFAYQGLEHDDRLLEPMIKKGKQWITVDWQEALEFSAKKIKESLKKDGKHNLGLLYSAQTSMEEAYLLNDLADQLGTPYVDYRLGQNNFDTKGMWLGCEPDEIDELDQAIIIGSTLRLEQPLLTQRFRRMVNHGGELTLINALDFDPLINLREKIICAPSDYQKILLNIISSIYEIDKKKISHPDIVKLIKKIPADKNNTRWVKKLLTTNKRCGIFIGQNALESSYANNIVFLANYLAEITGSFVGSLMNYPNGVGLDFAYNKREFLDISKMSQRDFSSFLCFNMEPDIDIKTNLPLHAKINQSKFKLAITPFMSDSFKDFDCVLPMSVYSESSGTFINIARHVQSVKAVKKSKGNSRPGWKILRVLGNYLGLEDFNFESSEDVLTKIIHPKKRLIFPKLTTNKLEAKFAQTSKDIEWLKLTRPEDSDMIVRRAQSLHARDHRIDDVIRAHPTTQAKLKQKFYEVQQKGSKTKLSIIPDDKVAPNTLCFYEGLNSKKEKKVTTQDKTKARAYD